MYGVERAPKEISRRRFIAWALVFILVGILASHIILPVLDPVSYTHLTLPTTPYT